MNAHSSSDPLGEDSSNPPHPKIRIKKYSNRRLYDMGAKDYITLDELQEKIKQGAEVEVFDSKTGEDLTQVVLIQMILESQKHETGGLFTTEILHKMIQYREKSLSEFFQKYLPNILQSYVDWQQEAQNHFLHWAQMGWNAAPYNQDWMTKPLPTLMPGVVPGFPTGWNTLWNTPFTSPHQTTHQPSSVQSPSTEAPAQKKEDDSELEALKAKISALEKSIQQTQDKSSPLPNPSKSSAIKTSVKKQKKTTQ
jgi:polyhydroxyalkanoate synthesis repressor PhaR